MVFSYASFLSLLFKHRHVGIPTYEEIDKGPKPVSEEDNNEPYYAHSIGELPILNYIYQHKYPEYKAYNYNDDKYQKAK